MILVDEKIGLFLNIKTYLKNSSKLFDYSSKDIKEVNTFIENPTYLTRKNDKCIRIDKQSDIEPKKGEELLFFIRKNKSQIYGLDNPVPFKNISFSIDNINILNNKVWYVLNSDNPKITNQNENYNLCQNDIIKMGNIKIFVKEIHINQQVNHHEEKKNQLNNQFLNYNINLLNKDGSLIFNFFPEPNNYFLKTEETKLEKIKCNICDKNDCSKDNPIICFCNCHIYSHFKCIKNIVTKKTNLIQNEDKTVNTYYLKGLACKKCNLGYPLKFQIKENEQSYEFFKIDTPATGDYLILELIGSKIYFGNLKFISLINLNDKEITLGRSKSNDVEIMDPSISRTHCIIKYVDGNIVIKNCSEKYGTLILVKKMIKINENKIQVQVGRTLIEAREMKYGEYDKLPLKNKKIIDKKD